jgi:hypothetical protein
LIRFADVERTVEDLARCLKPGGFLAIAYSNFRFADMAPAASFDVAMRAGPKWTGRAPIYGPDDKLIPQVTYRDLVFQKVTGSAG